ISAALAEEHCEVFLMGRSPEKAMSAAPSVGAKPEIPDGPVDLLVNATPVGQWPGSPDDPAALMAPGIEAKARFDVVSNPRRTAFLDGFDGPTVNGFEMLLQQGVDQLRHFGIKDADVEAMRAAGERALDDQERRIVLIGMRGAGKSAVARAIGEASGRPVLDTDTMVEDIAGRDVATIFREDGATHFRHLEKEAVIRALRRRGTVVALGGGAIEHLDGVPPESVLVWLQATEASIVERLDGSGRPSLTGSPITEEVSELLSARSPRYEELSHIKVDNDGGATAAEVAADVLTAVHAHFHHA
ncbi:MAG: shikimate kinase, partial [Planctomycetota bacterium]